MLIVLVMPILAACGDDDDDDGEEAETAAVTTTQPAPAASPTEAEAEASPTEEASPEASPTQAGAASPTSAGTGTGAGTGRIESPPTDMGITQEEAASEGGILVEAGISDISTLSPIHTEDTTSGDFQALIFESLFEANPETLEPVGQLAEAWEYNEDATVWTIYLREGILWHDGEPFTADDVVFTYERHLDPNTASPRTGDFESKIESIEAIDELTVQFNLKSTIVDFPLDLGVYGIIAEHIWADVDPAAMAQDPGATGEDPARVVGTGPFIFEEWVPEQQATAVPNPDYWDGAPHLERYVYTPVQDQAAGVAALQTGEVDWTGVPEASVADVEGNDDIALTVYDTLSFTFYGMNLRPERTPLFQDPNVRKAMLHAIDREALIESIRFGYGQVAIGTMPVLSWAYNPDAIEETFPYDVDLANQLLDEAGWTLGDDGVRVNADGVRFSFTMYTNAGNQVREAYLTAFQDFWAQVGIEMTPQLEPFPALVERIQSTKDFDAFLIGFNWSATPDQSAMFSCDSIENGFNFGAYCNEEVDALMQEALNETDQERRIELYTEFQNLILSELPIPVLDFPQGIQGVNTRAHNVFPSGVNDRWNAEDWWVEE
jgi:peptide/nickel transport system substrate-binding protein